MSRILLKKLTRKSIIQDGKNKGLSVQEVLTKSKMNLIYSYFNYANITFTDDILDELRIKIEDRIEKPGKAPGKENFYMNRNFNNFVMIKCEGSLNDKDGKFNHTKFKNIKKNILKAKAVRKYKKYEKKEKVSLYKGVLQRKNQGKY